MNVNGQLSKMVVLHTSTCDLQIVDKSTERKAEVYMRVPIIY